MHRLEKMFGKRRYRESVSSTEDETVPSTRNSISAARTGNLAASAAAATTTRRFQKKRNRPPVLAQAVSATNDDKKDDCDEGARCWACQVYLAVPTSEQVCCYVLHSHAVLEDTPICCVCQELVQDARDNEDACVGCGDDAPGRLFLCDATDACDCRFCDTCVQQALGSRSAVDDLAASDEPWECLACQPPPRLRALAAANCAAVTAATTARRTPEQIAEELAIAEEKKCSCLDLLDDEDTQRAAIAEELSDEEEVEEELEAWKTQQINHLARLDDFIASLQDELELEHHVNMSYCYDKLIESGETKYIELALDKKLQADEVNALREAKERDKEVVPVLPGEYYEAECYDDVEDIEDEKHVDTSSLRKNQTGWSTGRKPSTSAIRCAQEVEDERMAQMRVTIEAVKEEHDTNETIQENAESSMQEVSRGNVRMRVRRKSTAHRSRNPATEKAARTSSSESKKASSATVTALSQRKKAPGAAPKRVLGNAEMPLDLCSSSDEQDVEASVAQPKTGQGTSSFCICSSDVRKVYVNRKLVKLLKPHQKEGVQFIWNSSFCDFADHPEGSEEHPKLGGCILAHNMGLGKSFTTIALLYTVLTHSSMISSVDGANLVRTVLVVVPVNTLANWENEFQKWLDHLPNSPSVYNLSLYKSGRKPSVQRWRKKGGVLLVSDSMFSRFFTGSDREWYTKEIQPDVLVLDEAHTMLKNSDTQISKTLNCISTKRRIMLTGSPFQNNLLEYFRMCEFIRPGIFGIASEAKFEKEYAGPIMAGLVSDCSVLAHSISVSKSAELTEIMRPYIHRKDVSTLSKDLPPLTQVVLHVRQSRQQSRLYHAFMREQKRDSELKNFFKMFSELRPIHNHPFCLHMGGDRQTKRRSSIDEEEVAKRVWWEGYYDKQEPLDDVESGYKIVLLLHILAHASNRGEKVLIFSLCLKTLDYIELVLAAPDWKRLVPSLECFSGLKLGEWKKSRDFVRIDGDIQSADRGELVNEFNVSSADGGTLRAFLISSLAGGMGINLTGASRVVLVDSHFNPTISTQALFRAFRYGQTKPVYVYRFLTEGTIEEKVYGRSVNKTGLARRIIDKKTMNRCFSSKEIEDLKQSYQWVQCDRCEKWRMLLDTSDETNLPEQWFCEMNVADPRNNKCTAPERSQLWYEANCSLETIPVTPQKAKAGEESGEPAPKEAEDEILTHLLTVSESSKNTSIVSRHYFHESLLLSTSAEEEVEQARKHLEEQEKTAALDDCKRATDLIATSDHIKQKASPVVDKNGSNSSALVEALSEEGLNSSASAESRKKHAPDSEQPARRESPRTPRSKSTPAATPKANKSSVSFSPAYKPSKETPPRKPPSPEATPTKKPRSVASKDAEENDTQLSTDQSPDHSTTSSKKTVSGTVSRKRRGMPKKPLPNSPAKRPKSPPDEYTPDSKNCTPSKKASRTRKQAMKRKSATVVANDCGGDKVAATGSTCDNPWLHTKKTARKSMPSKQVATEKTARPVAAQDFIDLYESSDEEGGIEYV